MAGFAKPIDRAVVIDRKKQHQFVQDFNANLPDEKFKEKVAFAEKLFSGETRHVDKKEIH